MSHRGLDEWYGDWIKIFAGEEEHLCYLPSRFIDDEDLDVECDYLARSNLKQ